MPGGHHGKDPDHPDQADAHSGDHGGHQRIPHAPQAAADDLHRHIDPVPGRHQRHQPHAQRQHLCVIGKKIEEIASAGHEEQAPQYGHGQRHPHAELQAAFDSVIEPGSVVLAHKGHDGDAESVEDEPVHRIQLAHGHPGCDGIGAEAVDGGGDDHVGHRVKHRLQAAGQADAQDTENQGRVETRIVRGGTVPLARGAPGKQRRVDGVQIPILRVAAQIVEHGQGHEPVTERRGHAAAHRAQGGQAEFAVNQHIVAGHVEGQTQHADDHGHCGRADGAA